jgi:RNA polymerase sigma factor (sigma-70 family)
VPPLWSDRDWFEEIGAEVMVAALQAFREFDPARCVPWEAFLRRRVMTSALSRYRREWSYALRRVSAVALDEFGMAERRGLPSREALVALLQEALGRLPQPDAWLIESLFYEGKSEANLAECLGISQQAVNKRKRTIFKTLHDLIDGLAKNSDSWL